MARARRHRHPWRRGRGAAPPASQRGARMGAGARARLEEGADRDRAAAPPYPSAILVRSSASSSTASLTPCSRATSRSERPDLVASWTIMVALS